MNYCVLNGVKSTLIKGLLIQTLPPISKPLVRTTREEIDGRDGDIITKLGYSAYDKQMQIGLFGDYDIDEVIEYFNTEGTVIFSNEPDKFYYYQVIEQIDFEKLIRFKTATVTFHVQPFKYSAVDDAILEKKNKLSVRVYSVQRAGVSITVENGIISVSGTATSNVFFYIPINPMTLLEDGIYTLVANTNGSGVSACRMRIIENNPINAQSFGGRDYQLMSSISDSETMTRDMTFNYVCLDIAQGTAMNFELGVKINDNAFNSFRLFNRGNTISRPTFTIYGTGTIKLSLNGSEVFTINLASDGYITLDAISMNAYKGDTLKNRSVAGDFKNLVLKIGTNLISWTGNVTEFKVENVSRWI